MEIFFVKICRTKSQKQNIVKNSNRRIKIKLNFNNLFFNLRICFSKKYAGFECKEIEKYMYTQKILPLYLTIYELLNQILNK